MQKITIEQYIQHRLDDQIAYYSKSASRAKKKFQAMKAIEIALAASVPFLSALITEKNAQGMKVIVGLVGVGISLLSGWLLLYKYQENWVTYRTTCESLESERYLFLTRTGPYKSKEASALFIEKVESILGQEQQRWQSYMLQNMDAGDSSPEDGGDIVAPASEPRGPADENANTPEPPPSS